MKKLLWIAAAIVGNMSLLNAQSKTFDLYVIAEGNFGTTNGDVFKVSHTDSVTTTVSEGLYQTANNTDGIDVLQDFGLFGDKAVFCGKGTNANPVRLAITTFPTFDSIKTFTGIGGIQCLGKASNTKAYISMANNDMQLLDLIDNTLTPVIDSGNYISSYASNMVQANGYMYVATGSKIVKIDTITNATLGAISPNIGTLQGMEADTLNDCIWLLGKVSGTSVLVKMETSNNDVLGIPIILTGITNAAYLRLAANKLYFLSGKDVHAYNISSPNIPTTSLYTSTLTGGSFSFAYGKSFYADPLTGDFAMATAGNFAEASRYEIVDGTTLQMIDSGHVSGRIANELILQTYNMPVPDNVPLPDIYATCSVTLNPPTATVDNITITATTTDSLNYTEQGSYEVTWTYTNGYNVLTQTQQVTLHDTIAPVPDLAFLPDITASCPYTLIPPTASDNCLGSIAATTDSLDFTTAGTYEITWVYTDGNGNSVHQGQQLVVDCATSIEQTSVSVMKMTIYPNPAKSEITIVIAKPLPAKEYGITLYNLLGKPVLSQPAHGNATQLSLSGLPSGIYYIALSKEGKRTGALQKLIIQ